MADVVHRTTKQHLRSVNTPDYDSGTWIVNPDLSAVAGVPNKYWHITGDDVSEMNAGQKNAVDVQEANDAKAADKARHKAEVDESQLLRGIAKVIADRTSGTQAEVVAEIKDAIDAQNGA